MVIMFTFLSVFLLGLYGASVGSIDLSTTESQISGPWPTVSNGKCQFSSDGFSGSCNALDGAEQDPEKPSDENWHFPRSEEHTSELQSQFHIVCRLLLEKKK